MGGGGRVMEQISRQCERAQIIMGAAIDDAMKTQLSVTVIAAKKSGTTPTVEPAVAGGASDEPGAARGPGRIAPRCVPPVPAFTPEQREQVFGQHGSRRGRKVAARMRQAQLPLAIISKGR